mgnify:FL=1
MNIETVTQIITFTILFFTAILQIRNFLKYRLTNGANETRIVLFLANLAFITHTVRLYLDYSQGFFFTGGILCLFYLYSKGWIREKFKI